MYPGYKVDDVLNEYAIRFFALLEHGYRLRAEQQRIDAVTALLPRGDKTAVERYMRQLELAAQDPSDILKPSINPATPEQLKRFLQGGG
jgi:hypothetical protein